MKRISVIMFLVIAARPAAGQVATKAPQTDPAATVKQSLLLAEHGKCKQALQLLKKTPATDKGTRLKAGVATVSCALSLDQTDTAVEAIQLLNREFPRDPQVLYVTTHAYSDLSTRVALDLARTAPDSYQAHQLNAEALEMQGRWDDAANEYQRILRQFPSVAGIHYRLARTYLSKPNADAAMAEKAQKELQAELEIDPRNAGAEYLLGEMARGAALWSEAIAHFSRVTKLDPSFADAFLRLGMTCVSAGRFPEAIAPLETYVNMQPTNPAGHYHLALAYTRVGRTEDAKREAALQKAAAEKVEAQKLGKPPEDAPGRQEQQKPELHK